ncbi:uncharacterized protein LOC131509943 isoform X6 [Neofelis nebulosa]|uniref:uncharacterized protein LOC131509943 isoform X6 n=1 Tax=Neofelis nebulosa TaxID=61452 RepID=UPI00272B1360|nr:uncharacterized protein LOC131509943 isoform X6 [Neofelis nebulosa]
MPTPAITFSRMLGFLRFGPRSWGGDDSRQHPLTPPRVKLPSPPTPKQSQQRAEPQPLALCWGLEGLIVVLVSQQAKTFPVLLFKLASFPHRTLPLSSGDRCDIPNRGRRIHQRQRSAGAAKWPGSITDIVCVDGAPGAGQYTACTAASWGPDSTICTGRMQRKEVHLQTRKYSLTRRQICQCLDLGFPNLQSCGKINFLLRMFRPSSLW